MFKSCRKPLVILISSLFLLIHSGFIETAKALADPITPINANSPAVILASDPTLLSNMGQVFEDTKKGSFNLIKGSQGFIGEQLQHGSELSQKVNELTRKQLEIGSRLSAEAKSLLNQINLSQIITDVSGAIEGDVARLQTSYARPK